jgi:hypothetical protein
MDIRPTTRYPSIHPAASQASAYRSLTQLDGMEVVDEQVVVLSPVDVGRPRRRRHTEARDRESGGRDELG